MMRPRWNLLFTAGLTILLVCSASPLFAQEKPTADEQKRIDQLIALLGANTFPEREQAQKDLAKIGLPALESLRSATKNKDAEIARRAADLLLRLDDLANTAKQLAPKKVNLKLKDVSVADAVAELSKQSGYPIGIGGDKAKLAERKITLETGDTSFWEAFDRLCLKGGLVELAADAKGQPGSLNVADGTPRPTPTHYVGAVRIRVLPDSVKRKDGVAEFVLELAIEPRFRQPKVQGAAKIETALDERGQPLAAVEPAAEKGSPLRAPARLKLDDKQKTLKELSGLILFETILADKMLTIDKVAKNVGKTVKNTDGAVLSLDSYDKRPNGDVTIRATVTTPFNGAGVGGNVIINGNGRINVNGVNVGPGSGDKNDFKPELRDANGVLFQQVGTSGQGVSFNGTTLSISRTMTFRPPPGSGDAAELSFASDNQTILKVPFSFKDVTLP